MKLFLVVNLSGTILLRIPPSEGGRGNKGSFLGPQGSVEVYGDKVSAYVSPAGHRYGGSSVAYTPNRVTDFFLVC